MGDGVPPIDVHSLCILSLFRDTGAIRAGLNRKIGGVARPSGHMTHSILFFHEGMSTVHSWDGLLQAGTVDGNDDMAAVQRTMFYNRGNPETIMAPSCLCSLF